MTVTGRHTAAICFAVAVTVLVSVGAAATDSDHVFSASFTLSQDGEVSNTAVEIVEGDLSSPVSEGDYALVLVNDAGETVHEMPWHVSFTAATYSGSVEADERNLNVRLPYHADATRMEVRENGVVQDSIDLPGQLCVPDDACPAYCNGKEDPDCGSGILDGLNPVYIVFGLLAVLVIGFVVYQTWLTGDQRTRKQNQRQKRPNQQQDGRGQRQDRNHR